MNDSQGLHPDRGAQIAENLAVDVTDFSDVDLYQRREKIFTRSIKGFYQRLRLYSGWPFLLGYLILPWINWNGRQAILFDLPARKFYIFDITLWPQDFMLLAWLLIIAAFALFTFTSMVGRVWCGYTCPQTIWTAIFMWVEQITEGERHQRIRLNKAPWSAEKILKRFSKHSMWLGWAFVTGFTFVAYFTPARTLIVDLIQFEISGWALFWILFFTAATYINAGWMREQVCIYMCPYARFQSAMIDKDTLIVSYDAGRGEPRGARKKTADKDALGLGDCVDCQLCVQVCPTGIDIRNGLQYECIQCAHCIDACNQIMDKVGYPHGLIRYTTEHAMMGKKSHILRPRVVGYSLVLTAMSVLFVIVLLNRQPFSIDVIRDRGQLFHETRNGEIRNDYTLRLMNKTQRSQTLKLTAALETSTPIRISTEQPILIAPGEVLTLPVSVFAEKDSVKLPIENNIFEVCDVNAGVCTHETSRFFGPQRGPQRHVR